MKCDSVCRLASPLKKIVRKSHPNIFKIINVMRKQQATTEMKFNHFEAGAMHHLEKGDMCREMSD